jgi:ATP-binding cassette subfamily F protein uup
MALLISLHDIAKSYGSQNLFEHLCFSLNEGDRMGFCGPNGAGKSTLLKIIYGLESSDVGHIAKKQGVQISYVSQFPEFPAKSLEEILAAEVPKLSLEDALLKARIFLDRAQFPDPSIDATSLSGGWKKRLDVLRAWMKDPDLVLLDEPTNHLDLEGINWLEQFIKRERAACLIVSHDRRFLQNTCNKVAEIHKCFPQGIFISEGSWGTFLERKEAFLLGQQERERSLSGTVREEIDWLRRSPKARTAKSKSRIQRAEGLIDELQEVQQRNFQQKAKIEFAASKRETKNLVVATNLAKSLGGKLLFRGVTLKLSPGTRLGVVGKNGTGKTTLLKILSGEISSDVGTVKYAQDLQLVYFDQHRESLDPSLTLREALSPNGDFLRFQGQEIHVHGWAKKFLFSPERLTMSVSRLSGGEKARILLARLMLKPADVLFLDEPTNDLDIPTLEVIEESLKQFPGAVVLITHDRYFMDQICTQILALGEGDEPQFFADFAQWEHSIKQSSVKKSVVKEVPSRPVKSIKKLSYKEQKELEGMEASISSVEQEISLLQKKLEESCDHRGIYEKMGSLHEQLEVLYARWQYLLDASS